MCVLCCAAEPPAAAAAPPPTSGFSFVSSSSAAAPAAAAVTPGATTSGFGFTSGFSFGDAGGGLPAASDGSGSGLLGASMPVSSTGADLFGGLSFAATAPAPTGMDSAIGGLSQSSTGLSAFGLGGTLPASSASAPAVTSSLPLGAMPLTGTLAAAAPVPLFTPAAKPSNVKKKRSVKKPGFAREEDNPGGDDDDGHDDNAGTPTSAGTAPLVPAAVSVSSTPSSTQASPLQAQPVTTLPQQPQQPAQQSSLLAGLSVRRESTEGLSGSSLPAPAPAPPSAGDIRLPGVLMGLQIRDNAAAAATTAPSSAPSGGSILSGLNVRSTLDEPSGMEQLPQSGFSFVSSSSTSSSAMLSSLGSHADGGDVYAAAEVADAHVHSDRDDSAASVGGAAAHAPHGSARDVTASAPTSPAVVAAAPAPVPVVIPSYDRRRDSINDDDDDDEVTVVREPVVVESTKAPAYNPPPPAAVVPPSDGAKLESLLSQLDFSARTYKYVGAWVALLAGWCTKGDAQRHVSVAPSITGARVKHWLFGLPLTGFLPPCSHASLSRISLFESKSEKQSLMTADNEEGKKMATLRQRLADLEVEQEKAVGEEDFSKAESLNASMALVKQQLEQSERTRKDIRHQLDRVQQQMEKLFSTGIAATTEALFAVRVRPLRL